MNLAVVEVARNLKNVIYQYSEKKELNFKLIKMYEDAVKSYRNSLSKLSESERNKSIDRDIKTIIAIEIKTKF